MADKQTFSQTFSHSRSQRSCSHRAACGKKGPMWSEPAAHGPALPVAASGAPPFAAACKKTISVFSAFAMFVPSLSW